MSVYVDSSLFVSLYLSDVHSTRARALMSSQPSVAVTPLHRAEFSHAIASQVFFRKVTVADANNVNDNFDQDINSGIWMEAFLPDHAFDLCVRLARKYGQTLGIRTLDSLHVACALEFKADQFWTFDQRQAQLAKALGLQVN